MLYFFSDFVASKHLTLINQYKLTVCQNNKREKKSSQNFQNQTSPVSHVFEKKNFLDNIFPLNYEISAYLHQSNNYVHNALEWSP